MKDRIDARIAALEAELNDLKAQVATEEGPTKSDRRGMVKLLAAGAVGAVTGAAMLGAKPAAAADGDPLLVADTNEATGPTILNTIDDGLRINSQLGFGIEVNGGQGNALFDAIGDAPIGTNPVAPGILFVDGVGDWWASTDATATSWRKLASLQSAGQLHILAAPVRVYDSRAGEEPAQIGPKEKTSSLQPRTVDTTQNSSGVPATANAVLISFTIAGPLGGGFGSVWPSGDWPGTSCINFTPGQNIAVTTTSGCGPGATIQVLSNTVTDFLIDVIGYYQ